MPPAPSSPPRHRRLRLALRLALAATVLVIASVAAVPWLRVWLDSAAPSVSSGTPARGSLRRGHPIPPSGPGYATYAYAGAALGRQYVHHAVRDLLLDAFARVHHERGHTLVLGETGWPSGGPIYPHRTHRNGMSADVFVPVVDADGRPTELSCWPWNLFCYGLDFDRAGRRGSTRIDFAALAHLLCVLEERGPEHGLRVTRVILAPEYHPRVLDTEHGRRLGPLRRRFLRRRAWVRHDEHVHLDFRTAGPSGR